MTDDTIQINDQTYRVTSMAVMTQFHVLRRLAPLVTKIPEIVKSGLPEGTAPGGSSTEVIDAALDKFDMSAVVQPIVDGLSEMNDKDSEFVIRECLKTVQRHVPSTSGAASWSNVWNRQADQLQYQDIDLMIVLQLVFKVLMNFAAPFSSVLASTTRK